MAPLNHLDSNNFTNHSNQITTSFGAKMTLPLHVQSPARKCVSFSTVIKSHSIIHINDYSSEEKSSTWYCREELQAIKAEAKVIANTACDMSNKDECLRGLEAKTPAAARRKKENRVTARAAVFLEQEVQEEDGFSDPDAIADAYFECAERCQAEAQMMAVRDEKEAMEVYKSMKISDFECTHGRIFWFAKPTASGAA